ncbi:glycosyltransferase family 2 protein [Aquirufa sp.]|jgi:glycosyltransferase involved in cell wall biosynthesis|uniref:glycosyltransferase family 2 protein n=1 Tax=Aquirufa sp. TaxID=2676249 RepID=UPI0037BF44C2
MIPNLSIIVLTFNEEIHLKRLIENISQITNKIYVVDSFSTDLTVTILNENNINFKQNKFINHSKQLNFAIDTNPFNTTWMMRIDADEIITDSLIDELNNTLLVHENSQVNGFYVNRKVIFLGKELSFGSLNPMWLLRIWRKGEGYSNEKWMDEKVVLKHPNTLKLNGVFFDKNLNNLTWWTQKHNLYANREAIEILKEKYLFAYKNVEKASNRDIILFNLKSIYNRLPKFLRPILLFLYSYIFRLGILDGYPGLMWNILQVFWYRFLVDCKVHEIEFNFNFNDSEIVNFLNKIDE